MHSLLFVVASIFEMVKITHGFGKVRKARDSDTAAKVWHAEMRKIQLKLICQFSLEIRIAAVQGQG